MPLLIELNAGNSSLKARWLRPTLETPISYGPVNREALTDEVSFPTLAVVSP